MQGKFILTEQGAKSLKGFIETGIPGEIKEGELIDFKSDLSFLRPDAEWNRATVILRPSEETLRHSVAFRIQFGDGVNAVVYRFVQLWCRSAGTEQQCFSTGR